VVGLAVEHGHLTGAAGFFGTGGQHPDAGFFDVEDGAVRRDGEGESLWARTTSKASARAGSARGLALSVTVTVTCWRQ
jgi:hypothetical protein